MLLDKKDAIDAMFHVRLIVCYVKYFRSLSHTKKYWNCAYCLYTEELKYVMERGADQGYYH